MFVVLTATAMPTAHPHHAAGWTARGRVGLIGPSSRSASSRPGDVAGTGGHEGHEGAAERAGCPDRSRRSARTSGPRRPWSASSVAEGVTEADADAVALGEGEPLGEVLAEARVDAGPPVPGVDPVFVVACRPGGRRRGGRLRGCRRLLRGGRRRGLGRRRSGLARRRRLRGRDARLLPRAEPETDDGARRAGCRSRPRWSCRSSCPRAWRGRRPSRRPPAASGRTGPTRGSR